jgi:RNA polymerase sigma-70 factor (ECF subfamily)
VEQTADLVGRIEAGERPAEAEFVDRYARDVKLVLLKHTGNLQLANDLCQDTFVVALRRLRAGELRNPRALRAFVLRIAVNISVEHYRRERRYVHRDGGTIAGAVPFRDHKASRIDEQTARWELVQIVGRLPILRDREILRRFYLDEEEKAQICSHLNLSSAHFDRVLYRARQRLRALIQRQKGLRSELCSGLYGG